MECKVAVLGDADFVMPFSAMGLDTYAVGNSAASAEEAIEKIVRQRYGLVVAAENTAAVAGKAFERLQEKADCCVIIVPFTTEPQGLATEALVKALKMATGINILQSK